MTFVKVNSIPNAETKGWHDLQGLIKEFVDSNAKCVKMIFGDGDYKNPKACAESLRLAIKRAKQPVRVIKRGNDVYLKKF